MPSGLSLPRAEPLLRRGGGRTALVLSGSILAGATLVGVAPARAQDIEPRAFSNAPIGVNFLVGGYGYTSGGLSTDPAVPVTDAEFTMTSGLLGYARVINVFGMSGKIDAVVPYSRLTGDALFRGDPVTRDVRGFSDPRFRISVNFIGSPALTLDEFLGWEQDWIVGAALQVSAPLGQYDNQRIVNLGTNRWSFRPQLGASKAFGPLTLEVMGSATFFTDNTDFFGGQTREQAPIYAVEGHVIYSLGRGIWVSADATWFTGGRTTIDGERNDDAQRNWRFGTTLSLPLGVHYSVKLFASRGVAARTRNDYDLVGIALQYRWGGGL
ncbi:MAG: transporter [Acetobacteraceae bacterium]|nr:transporter [Acetobacteraceae bacterium]